MPLLDPPRPLYRKKTPMESQPILDNGIYEVPVSALKEYSKNPRKGDVKAISESLKVNGQFRPILVRRETREILAGNHTWKAAKELGWETIRVTYLDNLTDDQAKRIVLADNRHSDMAEYDEKALLDLLKSLETFDGTGYHEDYMKDLSIELGELDFHPKPSDKEAPDEFGAFDDEKETDFCCPKCGYEWSGNGR